ncbi:unnamed protein product [Schistocephalus solidus]|uniref:Exostosin domain-containing protein n=1 Tax=Schistocephalus solidus TaxID=70667 RepID=A0A183SG36_SCHSO|nr:unnamed protein product [Schistocephalus solidus]
MDVANRKTGRPVACPTTLRYLVSEAVTIQSNSALVYVYPPDPTLPAPPETYQRILEIIRNSSFYTASPEEACLFIPGLNTIDRDPLSTWFIPDLDERLQRLPYWSFQPNPENIARNTSLSTPGRNHLIFTMYSGTWPDYNEEDLRLNVGEAILAKASASVSLIRRNFDISFPLVSPQFLQELQWANFAPKTSGFIHRSLLTSFKGKRYLTGVGSETRNALYHLHNNRDIIIATTCRHTSNWSAFADLRCANDNAYYGTVSFEDLLNNSTFCLVPRGRRLATYRFLEVLKAECIPVILANDWHLPFSEVIDWHEAVILGDERILFTLPDTLRDIPDSRIIQMRERIRFIWSTYFSSLRSIIMTTLEIIRNRVSLRQKRHSHWNLPPGGLLLSPVVSLDECAYPSSELPPRCQKRLLRGFTLSVVVREPFCRLYFEHLSSFAPHFSRSKYLVKVLVIWQCDLMPPSAFELSKLFSRKASVWLPPTGVSRDGHGTVYLSDRFLPVKEIPTLAVWSLELSSTNLTSTAIEAAFLLWTEYPDRLVGFNPRHHLWNFSSSTWQYSANPLEADYYSIILLNAAVYHRQVLLSFHVLAMYYHSLYWSLTNAHVRKLVDILATGEDLLFNCVVGHFTKSSPLLLSTEPSYSLREARSAEWPVELRSYLTASSPATVLEYRHTCLRAFSLHFPRPSDIVNFQTLTDDFHSGLLGDETNSVSYLPLYASNIRY